MNEIKERLLVLERVIKSSRNMSLEGFHSNPGVVNLNLRTEKQTKSSIKDIVTQFDTKVENFIVEELKKIFNDEYFLGEEGHFADQVSSLSEILQSKSNLWIIDPIDGTKNYYKSYPYFSTTAAYLEKADNQWQIKIAITYDPVRDELFKAGRGIGAFYNNQVMEVSKVSDRNEALFSSGFAAARKGFGDHAFKVFRKVSENSLGVRRGGSAALDLAYVACGRLEGYWERGLDPWDIAAGSLLVSEAGGFNSSFTNDEFDLLSGEIVATNSKMHQWLISQIND